MDLLLLAAGVSYGVGLPGGGVRGPLLPATDAERHTLREDLTAGGVRLPQDTANGAAR